MSNQPPPADRPTGPVSGVHPEIDELSAYAVGDLAGDDAARVADHLTGCADCTADVAALRAALADLHAAPAVTMPADVAARLDDALRRERAAPATGPDRGGAGSATAGAPGSVRGSQRSAPWAGIAAGVAAVALGGAVVAGVLTGGGVSDQKASREAGAPAANPASEATDASGAPEADRGPAAATSAAAAATPSAAGSAASGGTTAIRATGTDYHRDTARFTREVRTALRTPPVADVADAWSARTTYSADDEVALGGLRSGEDAVAPELRPFTQDASRVSQCVAALTGGDPAELVSIDLARFVGEPAAVFVFRGSDPATYGVYVVRPDCGASETAPDPQLLYEVVTEG
jgi:hypothetical protein